MKIGFVQPSHAISPTGGVRIQGLMWKEGLEQLGHEVKLISMWDANDWASYDAFVFFGTGGMFCELIRGIASHNPRIAVAPIIDPHCNKYLYKLLCKYTGYDRYNGLHTRFYNMYRGLKSSRLCFTRSDEETEFLTYCCDFPKENVRQIPLSVRFTPLSSMPDKENFCLHISRLCSENKNVARLIEAARQYGFNLKLAGMLHGKEEHEWLEKAIGGATNIEYLGTPSDEEIQQLYRRAKVFALPSLIEGVGMVALEAAGYGCEIVLTNLGAPKEYFQGRARLVNPYSVEEIGTAICECLEGKHQKQPELLGFIAQNYSLQAVSKQIAQALEEIK